MDTIYNNLLINLFKSQSSVSDAVLKLSIPFYPNEYCK